MIDKISKIRATYSQTIGIVSMEGRGFSNPVDLAISSDDRFYVINRCNPDQPEGIRIGMCNLKSEYFGDFGNYGNKDGGFVWPTSLTIDSTDNVYVADEHNNRISIFDKTGRFLTCWGKFGAEKGQMHGPSGICFDLQNNLIIVDQFNNRIQKFDKDGNFLDCWGTKGQLEGQFNLPWGVSVTPDGDILVADWRNDRVQKFDKDGNFLASFGTFNDIENSLYRPSSAVMDNEGYIYIADWGNERVQILDNNGDHIQELRGKSGLSPWAKEFFEANIDQSKARKQSNLEPEINPDIQTPYDVSARIEKYFWGPVSIKLYDNKKLLIVESNRHRIQVYSIN